MKATGYTAVIVTLLAMVSACAGSSGPGPIHLYPGPAKNADDVSIIRVVKSHPSRGHPTIDIRKITELSDSMVVVFQALAGNRGFAVPAHFGGLPDPGQKGGGNPKDLPSEFHLPPGSYRIEYLYVPAVDRFGWTHRNRLTHTTDVICVAGNTYILEGKLHPDGGAWSLWTGVEETRRDEGGGGRPYPSPAPNP